MVAGLWFRLPIRWTRFWVKVARDQETMGWVREGELLKKVVPVDPISQFIHLFSSSHTVAFFVILALFSMGYLYRAVRKAFAAHLV